MAYVRSRKAPALWGRTDLFVPFAIAFYEATQTFTITTP